MTRVGQIGLGYWGKNIFRNFCELGVLASAYDASTPSSQKFRKMFFPQ